MYQFRSLVAVTLMATSSLCSSQTSVSFEDCNYAVQLTHHYLTASQTIIEKQLNDGEITLQNYNQKNTELSHYLSEYSLASCMERDAPEVFSCLKQVNGDISRCQ